MCSIRNWLQQVCLLLQFKRPPPLPPPAPATAARSCGMQLGRDHICPLAACRRGAPPLSNPPCPHPWGTAPAPSQNTLPLAPRPGLRRSNGVNPVDQNPRFAEQMRAVAGGKSVIMACEAGGTMTPSTNFPEGKASRSLQVGCSAHGSSNTITRDSDETRPNPVI